VRAAVLIPLLALGIVGFAAAAESGGEDRPDPPDDLPPAPEAGEVRLLIRHMAAAVGLDASWTMFLEAAAMGESGFNPTAAHGIELGSPPWASLRVGAGEAAAARKAWNRNKTRFLEGCEWPGERYSFGSGGLWGELPANALAAFKDTPEVCMDPWAVFEPRPALVMIVGYCRSLMLNWSGFKTAPTWGNLRVGMRAPSLMGRESELERQREGKNKLGDRLEQLGYDREFVDAAVTPLPEFRPVDWLRTLENV
jgi:hypothetical protein